MVVSSPLRQDLARAFGNDHATIRKIEELFELAGRSTPAITDELAAAIEVNAGNIADLSVDVLINAANIDNNAVDIAANADGIAVNAAAITALEARMDDFDVRLAEATILADYGDIVSVLGKAKSLQKFGSSDTIGTTIGTVWKSPAVDETYVATNVIDTISSSDAADTQIFRIEGHTVVGTGAAAVFTFVVQSATASGQSKVTLATPLARVSRITTESTPSNAGDIYVYEDTAIAAGIPSDDTKIHAMIEAGANQSSKAATSLSGSDYLVITQVYGSVVEKTAASVDFALEIRPVGGVFQVKRFFSASESSRLSMSTVKPYIIAPKNCDIRVRALASSANVSVSAGFDGYIAGIVT